MRARDRNEVGARLKRVAGQIQGLERMVSEERYCLDILTQLAAVRGAVQEVELILVGAHLQNCMVEAMQSGTREEQDRKIEEILSALGRVQR